MLTIGMPTYNSALTIKLTIDSILRQSFKDFKLIISDNFSTDGTREIITQYANTDSRIICLYQDENIGAANNFLLVSRDIKSPYFMWVAGDDVLEEDFVQTCILSLEKTPDCGMAFTSINNIDALGREIRTYPEMSLFSGPPSIRSVKRFINSPEVFGKANLFYSIYRTKIVNQALKEIGLPSTWGGDMSFVLYCLLRGGIKISPKILFHKRLIVEGGDKLRPLLINIAGDILNQSCPLFYFAEYERSSYLAARGTPYLWLVCFLMRLRYKRLIYLNERNKQKINFNSPFARYLSDIFCSSSFAFKCLFIGYVEG